MKYIIDMATLKTILTNAVHMAGHWKEEVINLQVVNTKGVITLEIETKESK